MTASILEIKQQARAMVFGNVIVVSTEETGEAKLIRSAIAKEAILSAEEQGYDPDKCRVKLVKVMAFMAGGEREVYILRLYTGF